MLKVRLPVKERKIVLIIVDEGIGTIVPIYEDEDIMAATHEQINKLIQFGADVRDIKVYETKKKHMEVTYALSFPESND